MNWWKAILMGGLPVLVWALMVQFAHAESTATVTASITFVSPEQVTGSDTAIVQYVDGLENY